VGQVLRHPRMDAAEFEQLKRETLVAWKPLAGADARAAEALALHFNHYPAATGVPRRRWSSALPPCRR
jgi:zinc protease